MATLMASFLFLLVATLASTVSAAATCDDSSSTTSNPTCASFVDQCVQLRSDFCLGLQLRVIAVDPMVRQNWVVNDNGALTCGPLSRDKSFRSIESSCDAHMEINDSYLLDARCQTRSGTKQLSELDLTKCVTSISNLLDWCVQPSSGGGSVSPGGANYTDAPAYCSAFTVPCQRLGTQACSDLPRHSPAPLDVIASKNWVVNINGQLTCGVPSAADMNGVITNLPPNAQDLQRSCTNISISPCGKTISADCSKTTGYPVHSTLDISTCITNFADILQWCPSS